MKTSTQRLEPASAALKQALAGKLSPADRELAVAMGVHDALELFGKKPVPTRPRKLPLDDKELLELVDGRKRGEASGEDVKKLTSAFGLWRQRVWTIEDLNGYAAAMLCVAYRTFARLTDAPAVEGAPRVSYAEHEGRVVDVLGGYGFVQWDKAPVLFHELVPWARRHLLDLSALPWELREAGLS